MKKKIGIILAITIAGILAFGVVSGVFAGTTRETDVSQAGSGKTLVLLHGDFQYLAKSKILDQINKIRKEACDQAVRDPRDETKSLKASDYVPIRWSGDLEWIAQTRAAEGSLYMEHTRPNGTICFTAKHNGLTSDQEVLAWNGTADILYGISQWYDEKTDWVNNVTNAVTGHYTSMINPDNRYIGIGAFLPSSDDLMGAVAGEFTGGTGLNEAQAKAIGECDQVIEVQNNNLKTSVSISAKKIHIGETAKAKLNMTAEYPDGVWSTSAAVKPKEKLIWSCSDDSVATISSSGQVTAVKPGDVTIKATVGTRSYSKKTEVEDHRWNNSYAIDQPATCTKNGKKSIHCSVCDKTKNSSVIPASGHKWKKGYTIDKKATLASKGSKSIHCSVCNIKKSGSVTVIPKLVLPVVKITKPKAAKKAIVVKWKKISKTNQKKIAGIEIQYSRNKNFKKKTKTIKAKKTAVSKKIKKLSKKKKYYIRIRTWTKWNGKKYTSGWSTVKTAKTK